VYKEEKKQKKKNFLRQNVVLPFGWSMAVLKVNYSIE